MTPDRAQAQASPASPGRLRARCVVATTPEEMEIHHRIRHEVFVDEQGLFDGSDVDSHDAGAHTVHALGLCEGVPVGVVRLFPLPPAIECAKNRPPGGESAHSTADGTCALGDRVWQGDRLAVLPRFRLGMGAPLVRFAVTTAAARGGREMVAHIQPPNVAFFEKIGWHAYGEIESYVGVPHQPMAIDLRPFRP